MLAMSTNVFRNHAEDACSTLSCLILMKGMVTDSDVAGTEKLAVTHARSYWLEKNLDIVMPEDFGAVEHMLAAGTCFLVKGWSRALCALGILRCAQESSEFMEVGMGMDLYTHTCLN